MDYWNNVNSLEEKALVKITLNLCQERSFKEAILGFKGKDSTFPQNEAYYTTHEEREEIRCYYNSPPKEGHAAFVKAKHSRFERYREQWEKVMDAYIKRMLPKIESNFRDEAREWIIRLIFEYLCCCRRLEVLTGLSRYFFVDFVTADDWLAEGRLDENKLAERLLAEGRMSVLQRYRIACTYCLTHHRRLLWPRLTPEEKESLNQNTDPLGRWVHNQSVLFWWHHMESGETHNADGEANLWLSVAKIAVNEGNVFALREAWKNLRCCRQEADASRIAYRCLDRWRLYKTRDWKRKLLEPHCCPTPMSFSEFCLPTHYARMMSFLFMNMNEDELEDFFEEILTGGDKWNILIYFLDWPNLKYFLPTARLLPNFIPESVLKDVYWEILLILVLWQKPKLELIGTSDVFEVDNFYEYRGLLRTLWDEIPETYKRFMFQNRVKHDENGNITIICMGCLILLRLLSRNPCFEEDEWLFKRILRDATVQEKKSFWTTEEYKQIYALLVRRKNWSLLNWLINDSFNDKEENSIIRRWYVQSEFGLSLCFDLLLNREEVLLNALICWSLESADERRRFKHGLINEIPHIDICLTFVTEGNFLEAQRLINFCLEPNERSDFKQKLATYDDAFYSLILIHDWKTVDEIVSWCFDSEEKIIQFKKQYFSSDGVDIHFNFVFREYFKDIQQFYEWFNLSSEEIEKLKTDTVFCSQSIEYMVELLYSGESLPAVLLLWSLRNDEMILAFKCTLEDELADDSNETQIAKGRLHSLIDLLLTFKTIEPGVLHISEYSIQFLFQFFLHDVK